MRIVSVLCLVFVVEAYSSFAGPLEDFTGLSFGMNQTEARVAMEGKGGNVVFSKKQQKDLLSASNLTVFNRTAHTVNLRFRKDGLASFFSFLNGEPGKSVVQQQHDIVEELQSRLGVPTSQSGRELTNPTAKGVKDRSENLESIWQLPPDSDPSQALYVLCSLWVNGDGKTLSVTLNLVSGANSPESDLTAILGRVALGRIAPASSHLAKLSSPTPTPPAPAAAPTPTPAPPPVALPPQKPNVGGLVLTSSWNTPMQGGTKTMEDLDKLFSPLAKASVNLSGDPSIEVYEGVPYLAPFQQALKPLGVTSRPASKVLIATPGFPRDSLYYYAVDGRFEDSYNRMYVVVDRADQVVSIQLVDETPRHEPLHLSSEYEWFTYNFVNARSKALNKLKIGHRVFGQGKTGWMTEVNPSNVKMFRVDSYLMNPSERSGQPPELKEKVRWYVPKPLVELILTCAQKRQ